MGARARVGCRECGGGVEEAAAALQALAVEIDWLRRSLDLLLDVLVDGPAGPRTTHAPLQLHPGC